MIWPRLPVLPARPEPRDHSWPSLYCLLIWDRDKPQGAHALPQNKSKDILTFGIGAAEGMQRRGVILRKGARSPYPLISKEFWYTTPESVHSGGTTSWECLFRKRVQ